ncbi:MAG: hypothetical protein JO021_01535 [Alphaproteobacteria bacterium]|nr:hypothetical protein [Alphaproteobacteria bacterium]
MNIGSYFARRDPTTCPGYGVANDEACISEANRAQTAWNFTTVTLRGIFQSTILHALIVLLAIQGALSLPLILKWRRHRRLRPA